MIHNVILTPDWKLINALSEIDKFGGSWASIEKREGQNLRQLKSIATVRSVGASTRIEGSKMTDEEVRILLDNLKVARLEDRDKQEVAGYFDAIDTITDSYLDIEISENTIKGLHNILLRYSEKDQWHRGNYKQHSNVVEATRPDGSRYDIFRPTEPGVETEDAMIRLISWYNTDKEAHPIVRSAIFVYDFLSIHPFQDGNGRLSRLIATLLLLKNGYTWVQYVSFEHEIESRKTEYYRVLMECQRQRPGEDVSPWTDFFLTCLRNIQQYLMVKVDTQSVTAQMNFREKNIYTLIQNHPGAQSGEIAEKLDIPLPTVKKTLSEMVTNGLLEKSGIGAGTVYSVQALTEIQRGRQFQLTATAPEKTFTLTGRQSLIELKKIILKPLFDWKTATEWSTKLAASHLSLQITCRSNTGKTVSESYSMMAYNHPSYHEPVFVLNSRPIVISARLWDNPLTINDYPVTVAIALTGSDASYSFDTTVVYDMVS